MKNPHNEQLVASDLKEDQMIRKPLYFPPKCGDKIRRVCLEMHSFVRRLPQLLDCERKLVDKSVGRSNAMFGEMFVDLLGISLGLRQDDGSKSHDEASGRNFRHNSSLRPSQYPGVASSPPPECRPVSNMSSNSFRADRCRSRSTKSTTY